MKREESGMENFIPFKYTDNLETKDGSNNEPENVVDKAPEVVELIIEDPKVPKKEVFNGRVIRDFGDPIEAARIEKEGRENLKRMQDPKNEKIQNIYPSKTDVYGGNGFRDSELDVASFLPSVDEENPDYKNVLQSAEKIVEENDAHNLVSLMRVEKSVDPVINPTVLRRLLEKYAKENLAPDENFIKIVDALTEFDEINKVQTGYDLDEELTDKNWARYYSVLKKAELELKDKTATEIKEMIKQNKLHKSVLQRLGLEYSEDRAAPAGLKEKITEVLK